MTAILMERTCALLQIMGKVEVVPGDLAQPQCGISVDNQNRLLPEVQYVIHAAASIQFDNPIHTDLTLSYVATNAIADFAAKVHGTSLIFGCISVKRAWAYAKAKRVCRNLTVSQGAGLLLA